MPVVRNNIIEIHYRCALKLTENKNVEVLLKRIYLKNIASPYISVINVISTLVLTERYVKKTLRLHTVKITLILLIQKKGLL